MHCRILSVSLLSKLTQISNGFGAAEVDELHYVNVT